MGEWAVVAEDGAGLLGFGSLDGDCVSALYVRAGAQRRGLGDALLRAVVAEAERRAVGVLRAEASAFSLGLFERSGFAVTETEPIERAGVAFQRHLVARALGG